MSGYKPLVVHIQDASIESRNLNRKDGSTFTIYSQKGLADIGQERRIVEIPCRNERDGLAVGSYELQPTYSVDQYGRISLDMRGSCFHNVSAPAKG